MQNTVSNIPMPGNEPVLTYAPGTGSTATGDGFDVGGRVGVAHVADVDGVAGGADAAGRHLGVEGRAAEDHDVDDLAVEAPGPVVDLAEDEAVGFGVVSHDRRHSGGVAGHVLDREVAAEHEPELDAAEEDEEEEGRDECELHGRCAPLPE